MLIRNAALVAGLMLALYSAPARAESGLPATCIDAKFIEVFPGAPGCEDVAYAVIEAGHLESAFGSAYITLGNDDGDMSLVDLGVFADLATVPSRLLIGTGNVEQYFGVAPDVVIDGPFPLRPESGWIEGCGRSRYGLNGTRINSCEGQAIHWSSRYSIDLIEPAPVNSLGERGQWAGCPGAIDVGARDAGDSGTGALCRQIAPDSGLPRADGTASSTETGTSSPAPEPEPADVHSDSDPVRDAGRAQGEPVQHAIASNDGADGCTCTVGVSPQGAAFRSVGLMALGLLARRRRTRG